LDANFAEVQILGLSGLRAVLAEVFLRGRSVHRLRQVVPGRYTTEQAASLQWKIAKAALEGLSWYFYDGSLFGGKWPGLRVELC